MSEATKIPTDRLKASERFKKKYNRDLVAALLTEPEYTVAEAEKILDAFMARPSEEPIESEPGKEPESDPAPAEPEAENKTLGVN